MSWTEDDERALLAEFLAWQRANPDVEWPIDEFLKQRRDKRAQRFSTSGEQAEARGAM